MWEMLLFVGKQKYQRNENCSEAAQSSSSSSSIKTIAAAAAAIAVFASFTAAKSNLYLQKDCWMMVLAPQLPATASRVHNPIGESSFFPFLLIQTEKMKRPPSREVRENSTTEGKSERSSLLLPSLSSNLENRFGSKRLDCSFFLFIAHGSNTTNVSSSFTKQFFAITHHCASLRSIDLAFSSSSTTQFARQFSDCFGGCESDVYTLSIFDIFGQRREKKWFLEMRKWCTFRFLKMWSFWRKKRKAFVNNLPIEINNRKSLQPTEVHPPHLTAPPDIPKLQLPSGFGWGNANALWAKEKKRDLLRR